jgi:hypothetical protein
MHGALAPVRTMLQSEIVMLPVNAELKYRWTMRQHGYPDAPVPEFSSAGCTLRMEEDHNA